LQAFLGDFFLEREEMPQSKFFPKCSFALRFFEVFHRLIPEEYPSASTGKFRAVNGEVVI
jgi:hypothetical protein